MTHTRSPRPTDPVPAVDHLRAAAAAADINTGGHLFSPWAALASQIRLTADSIDAAYPPQPSNSTPATRLETDAVGDRLRRAAEALDQAPPTPDALQWIWQVHQLRRLTARLTTDNPAPA